MYFCCVTVLAIRSTTHHYTWVGVSLQIRTIDIDIEYRVICKVYNMMNTSVLYTHCAVLQII